MNDTSLEIVRTLGVGGMATVYLASMGGRSVAVKKLHAFLAEDPMSVAILEDEANVGARIRHPNVVGVIDFVAGDAPALVMEWVEGVDLGKLARAAATAGARLPVDVACAIARDVLAGLDAAHVQGIVHRDVSPQNILVGSDGVTRVTDFGIAKAAWRDQHTEQGSIKGKLGYVAPERLEGRCELTADVYGVGVVLWELLTGKRFRTGDGVEVLVEILCGKPTAPSAHEPAAACLDGIVLRALERSPEDRFASAAEMIAMLDAAVPAASAARVAEVVRAILEPEVVAPAVVAEADDEAQFDTTNVVVPTLRITRGARSPRPSAVRTMPTEIRVAAWLARGMPIAHPGATRALRPQIPR